MVELTPADITGERINTNEKTYLIEGKMGVFILKHFTVKTDRPGVVSYWRWVSLDGKEWSNCHLDLNHLADTWFFPYALDALKESFKSEGDRVFEVDDFPGLMKNLISITKR